jgi:multidrug resistance efflux pump
MIKQKGVMALFCLVFLGWLALSGCSALSPATPTAEPLPLEDFSPTVSATGVVVPQRWSQLSVTTSGVISQVGINENDLVEQGQTLIELKGEANLQAALAAARFELASAQHALDSLYKDSDLRAAQAHQTLIEARQRQRDAQRYQDNLDAPAPQGDINQARANVVIAKDRLEKAQEDFAPYEKKPESNLVRAGLLSKLAQAEKDYEAAVRRLNNLIGTSSELDLAEAEADVVLAQEQVAVAERDYQIFQNGPDPDEVRLAEERVANAKSQVSAAEAALENLQLLAPFDGTISELHVRENEWIALGQPVLMLADLDHLQVQTTDLNEIDVARVSVGNNASLTFDALPDQVLNGKVALIAPKASAGSGVNYTVIIELDEIPQNLRWGMTAFVDIEVE